MTGDSETSSRQRNVEHVRLSHVIRAAGRVDPGTVTHITAPVQPGSVSVELESSFAEAGPADEAAPDERGWLALAHRA